MMLHAPACVPRDEWLLQLRAVAPEVMPWGTHAYIISAQQAERMALTAELMVARSRLPFDDFHTTSWQLDGEDIKIDHYLSLFYSQLTTKADKHRCLTAVLHVIFWHPAPTATVRGSLLR
jgi:hypothetical protein